MPMLDLFVVISYFVVMIIVAVAARSAKSMADFAVGSRTIPGIIIVATLSATYIGPGYSLGLADRAAGQGYVWYLIFLAFSVQTILVGWFVAPRLSAIRNAYTLGDVMGQRYGKLVQVISGIMSVILCAGFVGAITRASGDIISALTPLPFVAAIALSISVVILYSTFGGIKTVVITDVIQFVVLALAIPAAVFFLADLGGGAALVVQMLPESKFEIGSHFTTAALLGLMLGFLLGEALIPPYANRALMAKDQTNAKWGFVFAGVFSAFWFFVCATIGIFGASLLPLQEGQSVFVQSLQQVLPVGLLGLATAGMIAIIMSTQSSLLNAAAVAFSNDIVGRLASKRVDEKKELAYSKILTIIIGIIATIIALNAPSIVDALLICYTLWAPTIVLPLIIAVLKKDAHPIAGLAAILAGALATAIWHWGLNNPFGAPAVVAGIVANQIIFWIAQFIYVGKRSNHRWLQPLTS